MKKHFFTSLFCMLLCVGCLLGCSADHVTQREAQKDDQTISIYLWDLSLCGRLPKLLREAFPELDFDFVVGHNNIDFYAYLNDHGRAGFVMASSATDSANKDRDIREKLVLTGDVYVMVSVGNNFFYTLSLPCSLWFFDKAKRLENKNRVLFIDARNYYTVVDRTLNEWSEWQLKNLQAIVHLYRGETEKYRQLVAEYNAALDGRTLQQCEEDLVAIKQAAKDAVANAVRKEKKRVEREQNERIAEAEAMLETARQREWLTSKFGLDGEYQDVLGLCKIATLSEIEEKNYSLTPGAYVGVAEQEDDGVNFHERMNEIHSELASLNKEANVLMSEIMKEWETQNIYGHKGKERRMRYE